MASRVVVIDLPQPVLTATAVKAAIPALAGVADGLLDGLIAAATEEIDGPTGWLGRAIGRQTLELRGSAFPCRGEWLRLPLPPFISVSEVAFTAPDGTDGVVAGDVYRVRDGQIGLAPGKSWPAVACEPSSVRIRYLAGYAPDAIPATVKSALALRVSELSHAGAGDPALKKEVVEGVGSQEWDRAIERPAISRAVEALLSGLKVYSL
ncbi:MAG: hypothetical protein C0458_04330 [Methylobacterium sp.]|nr:hypothetical protein [Methylobacterium sp.]